MLIQFKAIYYNFYSKLISVWVEIEISANYELCSNQPELSTALHKYNAEQYHHFYSKHWPTVSELQ